VAIKLQPIVEIVWVASFVVQLALCGILIIFGHFRRLPFFTLYVCLNLCQALFLYFIYQHYGDRSQVAYVAGWWSEAITLLARLFATIEILHLVLISYRGIWGLAWRLLAATSVVVLLFVSVGSLGERPAGADPGRPGLPSDFCGRAHLVPGHDSLLYHPRR
jgi:hypothetical protein